MSLWSSDYGDEFITKLAQMRASAGGAGTVQGGGGVHPPVAAGGSFEHPGSLQGKFNEKKAEVDVGTIARLFGYQTLQEKRQNWDRITTWAKNEEPSVVDKVINQPNLDKTMQGMQEAGYPIFKDQTKRWHIPSSTPQAMMREDKPNEATIGAGGYDQPGVPQEQQPSSKMAQYRKGATGMSEQELAMLPDTDPRKQAALSYQKQKTLTAKGLTPEQQNELGRLSIQREYNDTENQRLVNVSLQRKENEGDEEWNMRKQKFSQEMESHKGQLKLWDSEVQKNLALTHGAEDELKKNPLLLQAHSEFSKSELLLHSKYMSSQAAQVESKKESNLFEENMELAGYVKQHISQVQAITRDASLTKSMSEVSLLPWFNQADMAFNMPTKYEKKWGEELPIGTVSALARDIADQKIQRLAYLNKATELLHLSGNRSDDKLIQITKWCERTGTNHADKVRLAKKYLIGELGCTEQKAANLIKLAELKYNEMGQLGAQPQPQPQPQPEQAPTQGFQLQ